MRQTINIEDISKYKLNRYQFRVLRNTIPNLHIYEKPYIGTEEIRQYIYCKRKIYFRYTIRAPSVLTYKMKYGSKKHKKLQKLRNKEGDEFTQKYYNIYLTDPELGLVGLIDYFEFNGKEAYPVEIKSGNIPPQDIDNPDEFQVAAQAILIEKNFDFLVKKVCVYYSKFNKLIEYPILVENKLKLMALIDEIRKLIITEKVPEPTKNKNKCIDCECEKFCHRG